MKEKEARRIQGTETRKGRQGEHRGELESPGAEKGSGSAVSKRRENNIAGKEEGEEVGRSRKK